MRSENINLTEGIIWKVLIKFSIPLLLSSLLQQLYNTADLLIVGRYAGKEAMAAVGSTGQISMLIVGLFIGLATGCSVMTAQYFGSSDRENLHKIVHTTFAVAIYGGLFMTILTFFAAPFLLKAMSTPEDIFNDAVNYLRIFFVGIVPIMVYNMGAGILRSVGDSRRPFNFLCISASINIILDIVLVAIFKMGVIGAGIATIISQTIAAILILLSLSKVRKDYRLNIREIKIYKDVLYSTFKIGIPAGLQSVVISFSNVLIQSKINLFGASAVAGVAASARIDGFVFSALQAFSIAATTFSGQNIGAGKFERLKDGTKTGVFMVFGLSLTLGAILLIFGRPLLSLFNSSPDVIEDGYKFLMYLAPAYWIFGSNEVLGGIIRGSGKALPPMIISVLSMCVLRMIWIYAALPIFNNIDIIALGYPVSWTATFILTFSYYKFGNWRKEHINE